MLYTTSEEEGEVVESEMGPMYVTEIDKVEIPAQAYAGEEVTMEDVSGSILSVIVMGHLRAWSSKIVLSEEDV